MANISGKATAITTISPMRWWKSYILRFLFRMITWGFFAKIQKRLLRLSFIHFAHWAIISRNQFPHLSDDQPHDRPHYDYLFFVSNFNGSWDQYIDAFSEVVPTGLDNIWRWSEKFPGAVPEDKFFEYIRHNQFATSYYYNATPASSATEIATALNLVDELYGFAHETKDMSPEQFAKKYEAFLIKVQNDLSETGLTEWEQTHQEIVANATALSQ